MAIDLPVHTPDHQQPNRPVEDVRTMAVAVQANLVQLKVADAKRRGMDPQRHDIKVPPPGAVKRYRETLIDPAVIAGYSDAELQLRLHEIWGQFCLVRWLFAMPDADTLADIPINADMHCGASLEIKQAELEGFLWRIRFESRRRADPGYPRTFADRKEAVLAERIPARAFGKPIDECNDDEVLLAGCEHAGMLAALRWVIDRTPTWGEPGIMDVPPTPQVADPDG